MKLATKLFAAPLVTALTVLAASGLNTWMQTRQNAEMQQAFHARLDDFKTLAAVQQQVAELHAGVYRTVALAGSLDEAKIKAFRGSLRQQLEGAKRTLVAIADDDPPLVDDVQHAAGHIDAYFKQADNAVDMATVDPNTGIGAMQNADASFDKLSAAEAELVKHMDALTTETSAEAAARAKRTSVAFTLAALLAAALAVGAFWLLQRRLIADLALAGTTAERVAQGRLDDVPTSNRSDELGDVLRALGRMTRSLGDSLRTVRSTSDSIHAASVEIAGGNADLSSRTEQAASSLQQTASSIEQITGTVRQNADAAQQADTLTRDAAAVAQRGGEVVAQLVSTMEGIDGSSRRIGDIIGVIDGIAFQTNILALNAAVEAARAGEQGRGFAVVASEVRSLAQRSATAAHEIKALVGDSVGRVEAGSRLAGDAGRTMSEIVASVQRVAQIVAEISATASEQSNGLGQVNAAVASLDGVTQQNAALVEQSAAAAESLKAQAARLDEVVRAFRLEASVG